MRILKLLPLISVAYCACATTQNIEGVYAPVTVAVPPADAARGLSIMEDGTIRHYNYGAQAEFSSERDGTYESILKTMYLESKDRGLTWNAVTAPDGKIFGETYNPAMGKYIGITFDADPKKRITYFVVSDKDGNFEKSYMLPWTLSCVSPRLLNGGRRIIIPCSSNWSYGRNSRNVPFLTFGAFTLVSDDFGKTWTASNKMQVPNHEAGGVHKGVRWNHNAAEPAVIELKDGRLWAILRTSLDNFWQSWSSDGGLTWSTPVKSDFHATSVMPRMERLSSGALVLLWANSSPLPEVETADGVNEDVFTNRTLISAAISYDDGKTWAGFRELLLDSQRNAADFADTAGVDKSLHQSQFFEVAPNKILAAIGQHKLHRRMILFDAKWLTEKSRSCDFSNGLDDWSVFNYKKGIRGHCGYNRISGCETVKSPDSPQKNCLLLKYEKDDSLVDDIRGAVWNFPASGKGEFEARIMAKKDFKGAKIMFHDRWFNPTDATAEIFSMFTVNIYPDELSDGEWTNLKVEWNLKNGRAEIFLNGMKKRDVEVKNPSVFGVSYAHFQTSKIVGDGGLLICSVSEKGL